MSERGPKPKPGMVEQYTAVTGALTELAKTGEVAADAPKKAIESYGIDPERPAPWRV